MVLPEPGVPVIRMFGRGRVGCTAYYSIINNNVINVYNGWGDYNFNIGDQVRIIA